MSSTNAHKLLCQWFASLGISKSDLAKRLGVHQSVVSRLIDGSRGVGLQLATAIERETANWEKGPIRPGDWAVPNLAQRKRSCQATKRRKRSS